MNVTAINPNSSTPEVQQAALLKKQLKLEQQQQEQLVESANLAGNASSSASGPVGQNLDVKA
jgi:hypothetical protein